MGCRGVRCGDRKPRKWRGKGDLHYLVDLIYGHCAVDLLHGFAGILHGQQSLLIDIRRLDGVDLVFQHGDLSRGLFERVLVGFFALERRPCGCSQQILD